MSDRIVIPTRETTRPGVVGTPSYWRDAIDGHQARLHALERLHRVASEIAAELLRQVGQAPVSSRDLAAGAAPDTPCWWATIAGRATRSWPDPSFPGVGADLFVVIEPGEVGSHPAVACAYPSTAAPFSTREEAAGHAIAELSRIRADARSGIAESRALGEAALAGARADHPGLFEF